MNFIAIDFETANEKRNSPCSIGLVIIEDNKIVNKLHYLIRPKEMRFKSINIGIHGIRPAMVKDALEFDMIWNKIKKYFDNTLIIAHNASFDISVLRSTLSLYNIELPTFNYICTMKLSKNFYTNLENHKLSTINRFLNYQFNHHDALADALACSNILMNISKEINSDNIETISKLLGVSIGSVNKDTYTPSSSKGKIFRTSNRIANNFDIINTTKVKINSLDNQVVVFTGKLSTMTRDEAIILVKKANGIIGSSVTRKTTILVTNMKDLNLSLDEMSTKHKKANILIQKGQKIQIINEDEFLNRIHLQIE